MSAHLADKAFSDLIFRVAELERRQRNRRRKGTIAEIGEGENAGKYRVKLSEQDGAQYLTGWIGTRQIAGGLVKIDTLRSVGEQVDVISENGELTDAEIDMSTYSNANPRANPGAPLHIQIGAASFVMSGEALHVKADLIVLDGEVHLGGEGGQLLHRKNDADSGGDIAVGSASRVYAV